MRFWPSSILSETSLRKPSIAGLALALALAAPLAASVMAPSPALAVDEDEEGDSASDAPLSMESYAALNRFVAEEVLVPDLKGLESSMAALAGEADAFCKAPDSKTLTALRKSWNEAVDAWMRVEPVRFGPNTLLMRNSRIFFWPDKRRQVDKQVKTLRRTSDMERLQADAFPRDSVAVQGLPAMARLLFPEDEVSADDFAGKDNFNCGMIQAISLNLVDMSRGLREDWTDGDDAFARIMAEAPEGNRFFSGPHDATMVLFKNVWTEWQAITDLKLIAPMGPSADKARIFLAESPFARRSFRNIAINLDMLKRIYGPDHEKGFRKALLTSDEGKKADAEIIRLFGEIEQQLASFETPLVDMVTSEGERARLQTLLNSFRDLKALYSGTLSTALGTPLGFNSLDGD